MTPEYNEYVRSQIDDNRRYLRYLIRIKKIAAQGTSQGSAVSGGASSGSGGIEQEELILEGYEHYLDR